MRSRLTKLGAALAAVAALAVGGAALASAGGGGSSPAKAPAQLKQQVAPTADADSNDSAAESGAESAESGSETPGDDGAGGHADEPGNPTADTQQEGEH